MAIVDDFKRHVAVDLVIIVAVLLGAAFFLVIFKWCFVRYNKRKYKKIPSSYKSCQISEKSTRKWSNAFTYESVEHVQPHVGDIDREMDYIIEPYQDLGKLQLSLTYGEDELKLGVLQAKGIIAKTNMDTSQVFVTVSIYKGEEINEEGKNTAAIPMVYEPEFGEEFVFKVISQDIQDTSLKVVLKEIDHYSKEHLIGQVTLDLKDVDIISKGSIKEWHDIAEEKMKTPYVGDLLLSLNYFPTAERLTMVVMKARNLCIKEQGGLWGPYVKIFLLRKNGKRVSKKRTAMQKKTSSPVYNEAFSFKISNDTLNYIGFKVVVTNRTAHGRDEIIGDVNLGPNTNGTGLSHWNHMMSSLRKPVAMWHPLTSVGD